LRQPFPLFLANDLNSRCKTCSSVRSLKSPCCGNPGSSIHRIDPSLPSILQFLSSLLGSCRCLHQTSRTSTHRRNRRPSAWSSDRFLRILILLVFIYHHALKILLRLL